ncbi:hypothetical protein C3L33_08180, partial [Rhododendron williamsianum]
MSSNRSSMNGHDNDRAQTWRPDISNRHGPEANAISRDLTDDSMLNHVHDPESMELYSRVREQQKEILYLREQISVSCVQELQLLNEKYALEKTLAELRLAVDEKQLETIASASNQLAFRKGDLEDHLKLTHDLKVNQTMLCAVASFKHFFNCPIEYTVAEDERYDFMSSMLGLLAEYGIWPRVINASTLSNNVKFAYFLGFLILLNSFPSFMKQDWHSLFPNRSTEQHLEPNDNVLRNMHGSDLPQMTSFVHNGEMQELLHNGSSQKVSPSSDRRFVGPDGSSDRAGANIRSDSPGENTRDPSFRFPTRHAEFGSFRSEEGPGIEEFQIIGEAKPGYRLLGCGFPVRGTSLCMFQDGTRQYIEGATNPEYVVTADDVDKHIAVECIPMDDQGRQGELVRLFANGQNKITCGSGGRGGDSGDGDRNGMMDASETWEPTTLVLKRSGYQIKDNRSQETLIAEKFSKDLSVYGSSHPLNTYNDVRMLVGADGFSDRAEANISPDSPEFASFGSEEGPGIEDFQIIGEAKPGYRLLGCRFHVRGPSLCMFQWVYHLRDGTRQYIEGATNPEYVVTTNDMDKLIAVECIPMDDRGLQMDSSEFWEPITLILKRSGYQIKDNNSQDTLIAEKFSKDISVCLDFSLQLPLLVNDGVTNVIVRLVTALMRDTLVLTMRMFQRKTVVLLFRRRWLVFRAIALVVDPGVAAGGHPKWWNPRLGF